jgi:uncharacterized protein YidB (DUF937 family)
MGLFDEVVSIIGKKLGGDSQQNSLIEQAMAMINNPETGGLSGLIEKFQKNGLGEVVSSWIGTGANQPVSADQINNALGTESIIEIAGKVGVSRKQISEGLASILPQIIDKLTPDGKVPEGSMLEKSLSALARKYLKG